MHRVERRPVDADGLLPALDLLTEPFAAAAVTEVVALTDGVVATGRPLRAPAILVRLKQSLARQAVVVRCTVDVAPAPAPVTFAAWSAAGSLLPLFVPAVDDTDGSGPVELAVQVWTVGGEAAHDPASALAASSGAPVAAADAAELVEALVVEGHVARVLHTLTAEKQRIVATAREITASRHVGLARAGALDALGAGHGVHASRARATRPTAVASSSTRRGGWPRRPAWRRPSTARRTAHRAAARTPGCRPRPASRHDFVWSTRPTLAVSVRIVEVTEPPGTWRDRFRELAKAGLSVRSRDPSLVEPAGRHPRSSRRRRAAASTRHLERAQPVTERRYMSVLAATSLDRLTQLLGTLTGTATVILLGGLSRAEDPRLDLGLGVTVAPLAPDRIDAAIQAARRRPTTRRGRRRRRAAGCTGRDPHGHPRCRGTRPRRRPHRGVAVHRRRVARQRPRPRDDLLHATADAGPGHRGCRPADARGDGALRRQDARRQRSGSPRARRRGLAARRRAPDARRGRRRSRGAQPARAGRPARLARRPRRRPTCRGRTSAAHRSRPATGGAGRAGPPGAGGL